MLFENHLLLGCWKVENLDGAIVRARCELDGAHRSGDIPDTSICVRPEPVLLNDFTIAIDYVSLFIATDKVLLVIGPCHGVYGIIVNIASTEVFKVLRVPNNDSTTIRARDHLLTTLHPFDLEQRELMLVLRLS